MDDRFHFFFAVESEKSSKDAPPRTDETRQPFVYRSYVEKALKTKGLRKMLRLDHPIPFLLH